MLSLGVLIIISISCGLIFTIGCFGNIMVFVVVLTSRNIDLRDWILNLNLAASDLCLSVMVCGITIAEVWMENGDYMLDLCILHSYVWHGLAMVSASTVMVIGLQRCKRVFTITWVMPWELAALTMVLIWTVPFGPVLVELVAITEEVSTYGNICLRIQKNDTQDNLNESSFWNWHKYQIAYCLLCWGVTAVTYT